MLNESEAGVMEEINLYDLMRFYARKWLTILIFVLIGAIVGIAYTYYIQQPQYKSTATLLLVGAERTSAQESVALNNYVQLFKSRRVLEPVISENSYSRNYEVLVSNTTAENIRNTDIIDVSISSQNADKSRDLLDSAISKFIDESKRLYGASAIKISVVDAPDAPAFPTNINPLSQIILPILAAFALSLVILFFNYDYRGSQSARTVKKTTKSTVGKKKSKKVKTSTSKVKK